MSNTIDPSGLRPRPNSLPSATGDGSKSAKTNSNTSAVPVDDSVALTTQAEQIKSIESRDVPEINQAKVDAIKAAIAEGSYSINPEKIADSFLKIEKALA